MENSIIKKPYIDNNDLTDTFKDITKGTFLDQSLVPITDNFVNVKEFSCYITGNYKSIEAGLLHEIAHAIQLKKKDYNRLKDNSFFKQPKSSTTAIFGKKYYEPISNEPTINECEAFAIQLVLLEFLNYEINHEIYYQDVIETLDSGALPDFNTNRKEMCNHLIKGFYYAWKDKTYLMELRFKNYCKYINNLDKNRLK